MQITITEIAMVICMYACAAAQILGIVGITLYWKLREFGIEASDRNG
ncbi:hypothetical protein ABEX29_05460 [Brevibacillus porteri]